MSTLRSQFVCCWLRPDLHRTAFTTLAQSVPQLLVPAANSLAEAHPSNQLTSLTNMAPLLRADYPNVNFWTRHAWTAASKKTNDSTTVKQKAAERGGTRMANDENVSMRFVEDAEGIAIGGRRAQDIRRHMRSVFNHLADQPGGPASTWTGYAGVKQQYYYQEMGNLFPELRLCELSWKADKLAIDAYPSWYQTYLKKDRDCIKMEQIKAEGSEDTMTSLPEKRSRSRSPPLPTLQKKQKTKNSIPTCTITTPTATSLSPPPEPASTLALASLPHTTSSPIASHASGPAISTSATADGSIQDQEESASEATIPLVSDGRGADKDRTSVLKTGVEEPPKVRV